VTLKIRSNLLLVAEPCVLHLPWQPLCSVVFGQAHLHRTNGCQGTATCGPLWKGAVCAFINLGTDATYLPCHCLKDIVWTLLCFHVAVCETKSHPSVGTEIRNGNEDAAVFAFNAPLHMTFTRFHSNNCTDRLKGGSPTIGGCIKVGSVTSVRLAESSTMTDTAGYDLLLEEWNSTLYTNTRPNGALLRENPKSRGRLKTLSEVPNPPDRRHEFLTLNDPDYKLIVQVCVLKALYQGSDVYEIARPHCR
jgi:hypothetical protein